MGIKNKRPDLNGVLVIDKPLGWTSASVCGMVRRVTRGAKVGHAGTLDPLATGVLVLCLGSATKLISTFMDGAKRYLAHIDLAHTSPTDDLEGEKTPVPVEIAPSAEAVRAVLAASTGLIQQRPPIHSAVWVDGTRAYTLARSGQDPDLKPRTVRIDRIDLVSYRFPELVIDVSCGKGTYIRSLARDIGRMLGTGGMLTALRRTQVGPYEEADAVLASDLEGGFDPAALLRPVP